MTTGGVVFREILLAERGRFRDSGDVQIIVGLIDRSRAELRAEARPLGERLFAEKPEHLTHRYGRYWKFWLEGGQPAR
jgi:hypothetical protein